MANGPKVADASEGAARDPTYKKTSILQMSRYRDRADLLGALLSDDQEYTHMEISSILDNFMKGR